MEPKETAGKKTPSAKSLNELMNLLMKLNDKLREKMSPPSRKKEEDSGKMDVVIIIMTNQEQKVRPGKTIRTAAANRSESSRTDWLKDMFDEIERNPGTKKEKRRRE